MRKKIYFASHEVTILFIKILFRKPNYVLVQMKKKINVRIIKRLKHRVKIFIVFPEKMFLYAE